MRLKRRASLISVLLLTLACYQIVFRPIQLGPFEEKRIECTFRFRFEKSLSNLVKTSELPEDVIADEIDKLRVGTPDVRRSSENTVSVLLDAKTATDASDKEQSILKALDKRFGKVELLDSRRDPKGREPIRKLGYFGYFKPFAHLKLGLDLQGGTHLVLQCRRALFEYKFDQPLAKDLKGENSVKNRVRDLLARQDLKDIDVSLNEKADRLSVKTQAKTPEEFNRQSDVIFNILKLEFPKVAKANQQHYEFKYDTIKRAKEIVELRINKLGVTEPVIQTQGDDRVVVELPGIDRPEEAIALVGKTAQLEFRKIPEKYKPHETEIEGKKVPVFEDDKNQMVPSAEVYEESKLILTGAELMPNTAVGFTNLGQPEVNLEFNSKGRREFADFTRRNVKKYLGIFLDGEPVSAPIVNEPITGGKCQISGGFKDTAEATRLQILLNAGALPIPIDVVENRTISATLGRDSIAKSLKAALAGLILVMLFMIAYYRLPGLLADVALAIYCLINLAVLSMFNATLTLPGIAGVVLAMGMSVDTNVLIFERLKEELRTQKTFKSALEAGFVRAWTAILDSHVTTFIAAAVLFFYGTGAVKGFALTLIIGVLSSLFTANTISRLFIHAAADTKLGENKWLFNG